MIALRACVTLWHMKPDFYTKSVLTVIAIMLTVIACKTVINPDATASAQSAPFAGVQYASSNGYPYFFDTRTGEIYSYQTFDGKLFTRFRLTKLGQALTVEPVK